MGAGGYHVLAVLMKEIECIPVLFIENKDHGQHSGPLGVHRDSNGAKGLQESMNDSRSHTLQFFIKEGVNNAYKNAKMAAISIAYCQTGVLERMH